MAKGKMLIVEDTQSNATLYQSFLKNADFQSIIAETGKDAFAALCKQHFDAVILDLHLPDMNGREILKEIRKTNADMPVIVVTAFGSINLAVECLRYGAYDFIAKPFSAARLTTTLENALKHKNLTQELGELRRITQSNGFANFIGTSPAMQAVYRQIESVACSNASVFISGESGTGKELAAHAIHNLSPRAGKPFIALNCAAMPHDLLESHIFGHMKGAFTGAAKNQMGAAQMADGGTLFLDEICEMNIDLQAKILRFIQTGSYTPIGSSEIKNADLRFLAATNRKAIDEVEKGNFREDLYYRLHVVPITMPPLRDRDDDMILLANYFLQKFSKDEHKKFKAFDQDAITNLLTYEWLGNVRQLANSIQQMVVMNNGTHITAAMLPPEITSTQKNDRPISAEGFTPFLIKPLWQIEKDAVMKAIMACQNDIPRAASMLEVSPSTLYRKLQVWRGIDDSKIRA